MIRIVLLIYLWAGASAAADERLSGVTTWMYQLQGLDEPAAWGRLAATDYDMLVLEPGQNFAGWAYGTGAMVRALRHKPDGSRRVLLAYVNIGQAEDYRDYWRPDWVAPVRRRRGVPSFLIPADPDGWPGNYPVAYWDPRWQAVWLGGGGLSLIWCGSGSTGSGSIGSGPMITARFAPRRRQTACRPKAR